MKLLTGGGKAEDVKPGVEQDPEAEIAIACPLCGAMFNLRTGDPLVGHGALGVFLFVFLPDPIAPSLSTLRSTCRGVLAWVAQDEGHTCGDFSFFYAPPSYCGALFRCDGMDSTL